MITPPIIDPDLTATQLDDGQVPDLSAAEVKDIKRRSISGTISYLLRTAVLQGLNVVGFAVLSLYLIPADFGIYGVAIQIMGLLVFFSDIGLAASLVQSKTPPSLTDFRTAFTVQQILAWAIVGVVGLIIASGILQDKIGMAGIWLVMSMAISFPIAGLKTIPSIIMERKLEFSRLVIPQIVENLIFQGLLVYLAINGYGVTSYTYAFIARAITGAIVMYWLQPWSFGLALNRTSLKGMLNFGAKFQLNDFLARIKDNLFYLFLARFFTPTEFGYVTWSKNLSVFPYSLTVQNVTSILFPTFARLQSHPQLLKKAIEKCLFFSSVLVFPMLAGMCVFIWPATQAIEKFGKWEPAVLSFIFFSLSVTGAALSNPITNMLNAIGKIDATLKFMLFWTALTWTITPVAVWQLGYNGVAIAAFLISLTSVLPIFYIKRSIDFNFWGQVTWPFLATMAMVVVGLAGMQWWSQNLWWLLLGIVVSGASYGLVLLLLMRQRLLDEVLSLRT